VVLGPVGRNLGAGMSGGEIYVYDPDVRLEARVDSGVCAVQQPTSAQLGSLERIIRRHMMHTGSRRARDIVASWQRAARSFRRVAPRAEIARLEATLEGSESTAA
jgi:glutamate synthase domain-containing protein 3